MCKLNIFERRNNINTYMLLVSMRAYKHGMGNNEWKKLRRMISNELTQQLK